MKINKSNVLKRLSLVVTAGLLGIVAMAQNGYTIKKYDGSADFGILYGLTPNGEWGLIQCGSYSAGGSAKAQVFNTATGLAENRGNMDFVAVSNDANIVVGRKNNVPAIYNHSRKKYTYVALPAEKMTVTVREDGHTTTRELNYIGGTLTAVTPDGKYAVGVYNTEDEMCFSPVFVNVADGSVIETPGLPELDMTHQNQGQNAFRSITPDGRYIIGMMSESYLSPASLFTYVYDTQNHTYEVIGYKENKTKAWEKLYPGLFFIDGGVLSPDGRYLAGEAYITNNDENSFGNEYSLPYRYDLQTKEFKVFDSQDMRGKIAYAVDTAGTIFVAQGSKGGTGTPMRDFSILYKDKYPVAFSTICSQYFGFDFQRRTGYENTGTPMGVSEDNKSFVSFADPQGESYWFHMDKTFEEVCAEIDLLGGYSVLPQNGAEFAKMGTVKLTFDRAIEVLGGYDDVSLLDSKGNVVAHVASSGFTVSSENPHQVLLQFSTRGGGTTLNPGEKYTLVVNAGTICVAGDNTLTNKEIRINYNGRADKAVEMESVIPTAGSELAMFDNISSYVTITFDSKIMVNDGARATLQRKDGTILAYLNTYYGNQGDKGQVALFPSSTCYLYAGQEYDVVLNEGCVTDLSGAASSANKEIRISYKGIYERPVPTDGIIFKDDFDNLAESLNTWMRYDGDQLTPNDEMMSWEFNATTEPWNFSIRDNEESTDLVAASHSMYKPAGQSIDLMMTPQMTIPGDDNVNLEFDAQSYKKDKTDRLQVLVWATDTQYGIFDDNVWAQLNAAAGTDADVVFNEVLSPGETEGNIDDEWTHYTVNLGKKYKNKNIYVIFFNNNKDQSAIFVNNVIVKRDMFYKMQFSNEDMVVAKNEMVIKGKFAVAMAEANKNVSLTLSDSKGNTVSTVNYGNCVVDQLMDFTFAPLPLTIGAENNYTITIKGGEKSDTYEGVITDLSFNTTKHVVLEEMTGQDCVNCPLGILTIDKLKRMYGEQFIPISLHTYTGDQLGAGVGAYSNFLELMAAPSARIDRIEGTYFPMVSVGTTYYDELEGENLWINVVKNELQKLAPADLSLAVEVNGGKVNLDGSAKFALNYDNKQYNVFYVFMEDGLTGHQANNLLNITRQDILGEWCDGGIYATTNVSGFVHNDVARGTVGMSYSGTPGLIPSTIVAGQEYAINQTVSIPENITNTDNMHVAMMLIDASTGMVVNAIDVKSGESSSGINENITVNINDNENIYDLMGRKVEKLGKGIYIKNGRKFINK